MQILTWNSKFKLTCVDFQEKAKWSMFCVWIICSWIPWWLLGSWNTFVGADGGGI
jgi:hypothetical protein